MKVIFLVLLFVSGVFSKGFNDEGSTYNPFTFVKAIKTANNAYTLEFRNDEESYFTNFYITSKGVIAFDPLSDIAAYEYVKQIKKYAPNKPLLAIVYSHLHTDHIAGARVLREEFGKNVPIIAHERVEKYLDYYNLSYIDKPNILIPYSGKTMKFGNTTIEFKYLGSAHTDSIIVAIIKEIKQAYICDFANNDVVGWTNLPGINLDELIKMKKEVLKLDIDVITFCHGKPGTKEAIKRQVKYYDTLFKEVSFSISKGMSLEETQNSIELEEFKYFKNYDDWFKGNIEAVYLWLKRTK
ncbi:MBL fold metallo-hydrolase [Poseidonibacter lekithochrous]|uniref:MBL fold metallo-hydrolase n=1 Tax=Poseidonibacter lekithochrous TaxID=1904463 RepID=UPI0008FC8B64|nr:MBL fold metallo-hydrolase [Poseidonibacter lekithochrous]QKJ22763.1 MBL fold metallohydrolase [Poseidonibacter lekithochrous]